MNARSFGDYLVRFLLGTAVGLSGEDWRDGKGEAGEERAGQGIREGENGYGDGGSLVEVADLDRLGL